MWKEGKYSILASHLTDDACGAERENGGELFFSMISPKEAIGKLCDC